jgi:hypothetical protein
LSHEVCDAYSRLLKWVRTLKIGSDYTEYLAVGDSYTSNLDETTATMVVFYNPWKDHD